MELGMLALFALFLGVAVAGVWLVRSRTLSEQATPVPAAAAQAPEAAPEPAPEPEPVPAPAGGSPEDAKRKLPVRTSLHNDPIDMLEERQRDAAKGSGASAPQTHPPPKP
jgi:hypothetical protein